MNTNTSNTLSCCMIVKNEEKFLEQCLNSIKDLVDEIIIVDTGSTDKTKEIAARFTDKIFDFKWCDDFAAARNESLKHATGDWILVLDADETISAQDHAKIKELIQNDNNINNNDNSSNNAVGAVGYILTQRNYFKSSDDLKYDSINGLNIHEAGLDQSGFVSSEGDKYVESGNTAGWLPTPMVRLFQNVSGVSFYGVVHEDVSASLKGNIDGGVNVSINKTIIPCNIPIHHFGKMDIENWKRKWIVYEKLAEKKVEQEQDYYAYYELGRQYLENRKMDLAKEMFLKSISLKNDFWITWFNVGSILLIEGNLEKAIESLEKARSLNLQIVSIHENLGIAYAKTKQFQKAIESFVVSLELHPQASIFKNMGICYEEMGDTNRASLAYARARKLDHKLKF